MRTEWSAGGARSNSWTSAVKSKIIEIRGWKRWLLEVNRRTRWMVTLLHFSISSTNISKTRRGRWKYFIWIGASEMSKTELGNRLLLRSLQQYQFRPILYNPNNFRLDILFPKGIIWSSLSTGWLERNAPHKIWNQLILEEFYTFQVFTEELLIPTYQKHSFIYLFIYFT